MLCKLFEKILLIPYYVINFLWRMQHGNSQTYSIEEKFHICFNEKNIWTDTTQKYNLLKIISQQIFAYCRVIQMYSRNQNYVTIFIFIIGTNLFK